MIERLLKDHRQIGVCAGALLAVIDRPRPDLEALKDARWECAKAMMQHLAFEDRHLCLPLENHPRSDVGGVARALKAHLLGTQADYEAHTARWTAAATSADWPGYRRAARRQIDVLIARMAREEAELFPLSRYLEPDISPSPVARNWARAAFDVRTSLDAG